MKVTPTAIADVLIIEPKVFGDARGFFFESFNQQAFNDATGTGYRFVQDNHSRSARGVLRRLHYQIEQPQGKLVRVMCDRVFDVAVDIRQASPTFDQWVGVELGEDNHRQLWVPPGLAHERRIAWNDPAIGIEWPLAQNGIAAPLLSAKDLQGRVLANP
jgi:dTDP-4-dehydrorhamnose 3,5-epimerase